MYSYQIAEFIRLSSIKYFYPCLILICLAYTLGIYLVLSHYLLAFQGVGGMYAIFAYPYVHASAMENIVLLDLPRLQWALIYPLYHSDFELPTQVKIPNFDSLHISRISKIPEISD